MSTPTAPLDEGLVHLGLVYADVDELVVRTMPEIRAVLDVDGTVSLSVDRRGVRAFREALGGDAERVSFPSPRGSRGPSAPEYLRAMRSQIDPTRRTLVLGQYTVANSPDWDCAYAEDAVNLVLADQPLTVMCATPRSGGEKHIGLTLRSHPRLLDATGRVPNPHHRPPTATCPASMDPWGVPLVSTTVADGDDLAGIRRRVSDLAESAGLAGDAVRATVLAVHEAVLLAAGAPLGPIPRPPSGEQEVAVRAVGGAIVTEVLAATVDDEGEADGQDTTLRRTCLEAFCRRLTVHDGPGGRLVRVLCAAG